MSLELKSIIDVLTYISPLVLIVAISKGAAEFQQYSMTSRVLLFYLTASLICDLLSRYFAYSLSYNLFMIPLYNLLAIGILSFLYLSVFRVLGLNYYYIVAICVLYNLYEFLCNLTPNPASFHSYSIALNIFIVVFFSINYFIRALNDKSINVQNDIRLNGYILFYHVLHLIFIIPINFLINLDASIVFYFWLMNLILTIIYYTLITTWIWKHGKTQTQ